VRADGLSTVAGRACPAVAIWRRKHSDRWEALAIGPIPGHVQEEQDEVRTDCRSVDRSHHEEEAAHCVEPQLCSDECAGAAANPVVFVLADQSRFT
jgi:hypothetical protein